MFNSYITVQFEKKIIIISDTCLQNRNNILNQKQNNLTICLVLTKASKEERRRKEENFLDLCREEDLESVKTLLAEDPSLINIKDKKGNFEY